MSDTQQYSLRDSCFASEIRIGCVRIENTDRLPLDSANFVPQLGHVTLALMGATGNPSTTDSFVAINTFQFPEGNAEFERVVEWFGQDRRSRAKLPDGIKFDDSVLAVRDAPADWQHEAYPQSNRAFVHIYRGPKQAILTRWIARTGTILDHPLFTSLLDNLRIVPGQWITEAPVIQPKHDRCVEFTESPLTADDWNEIDASTARARDLLQLDRSLEPTKTAEAIYEAIDNLRSRKSSKAEKQQFAVDCGALWGQALCEATGWEWRRLEDAKGATAIAACSRNRSHAVLPLKAIYDLLAHPKAENNSLLLFDMIASGEVPASAEGAYSLLR